MSERASGTTRLSIDACRVDVTLLLDVILASDENELVVLAR